ncbi:hypothetical protein DC522_20665 [Microvirga sp. KLBC 81]|nr:hypothetical protein DC522_20665 [Microvirga sp. KLBC 81]
MRVIGLDVHRTFAVVAVLDNTKLSHLGRVDLTRDAVLAFGRKLQPDDEVVIEATVKSAMIVRLLRPGSVAVTLKGHNEPCPGAAFKRRVRRAA